jgi:hypothetical protein
MVDVETVYNNYVQYVFGDQMLAALGFLFILTMVGIRFHWNLETYVIVFCPALTLMLGSILPMDIQPLVLIGLGSIIGMGLLAYIRR